MKRSRSSSGASRWRRIRRTGTAISASSSSEAGKAERAIEAYRRAIAIDPGHANAHSNLGVLLRATGNPSEAEAAYRTAIRLQPDHIDAYTNLGILLNGLKRTEEAAACYCKVITLRPKHREARRLLALAHCTLGDDRRGREDLRRVARGRARGSDCAAHAGGLHGPGCAGARIGRIRRETLSTVSPPASNPSSRSCRIAPRRSWRQCWRIRVSSRRSASTCWMPAAEPDSAVRSWRRMRADWWASTSPTGCWLTRKRRTSTMSSRKRELTEYLRGDSDALRPDRVGGHAGVFRRPGDRPRRRGRSAAPEWAARSSRSSTRSPARPMSTTAWSGTAATVTPATTSSELLAAVGLQPEIALAELRMEAGAPVAGLVIRATKSA